ncbi:MAG: sortase [Clostridia bacterium]|nr:sortase [Clostridia bacterium]
MPQRDYYRKRHSPWPRRILMALLAAMMLYAAVQLIGYIMEQQHTRALQEQQRQALQTEAPTTIPTQAPTATPDPEASGSSDAPATLVPTATPQPTATLAPWLKPDMLATYQRLYSQNNDLVGWLNIDALYRVDFAVVQRDQSYYLRRDFYGERNMNGTAFMDMSCSIWPRDDNLIIYAHNMKSGEMFGELHKLAEEEFYRAAPITWFDTLYEKGMYVPLAVILCTVQQGPEYFRFYERNFKSQQAFDDYVARARALSKVDTPYDARYGDELLTLVTCYDEADTQRFVVVLRKVRAGENADALAQMW